MNTATPINAKLFLITACCLTAAGCIFYYFSQPTPLTEARKNQKIISHHTSSIANHEATITHEAAINHEAVINHEKIVSLQAPAEISTPTSVDEIRTIAGTPAEAAIVNQWRESRGYYSKETLNDYLSYDWDTLVKLSDEGDIKAMMALADLCFQEPYASQGMASMYLDIMQLAVLHGSTQAIQATSFASLAKYQETNEKGYFIEYLAWNNTAALRNDIFPIASAIGDAQRNNIELSSSDIAHIHSRSQEIYNDLEKRRAKLLGLGAFDNSIPNAVEQYHNQLRDVFKKEFDLLNTDEH